jgi:hypothetical protein
MDDLIKILENFNLTNNKQSFEKDLDDVIDKLDNLNNEDEWIDLKSNYSKLRYLSDLISSITIVPKFKEILSSFMNQIDKTNQRYLRDITWSYKDEYGCLINCYEIKDCLEKSLNNNDPINKLKYAVESYDMLVPIVEYVLNQRYVEIIDDQQFLSTFPSIKRRKL